ncbi:hypothetical protein RO3G_14194 [Rhizopus delemar RA 99-880]|uniref:Uncharacterized protein n=1 Tax=Rhizopus delemar (strain RA 99-880 / ATCC MYA-4621 / FGSC 9543 / NRRL 43880) TaxID=246409 RepID=I1CM03_RHIO9|nr:hypothetical protein RO3G_14194 [Rhizopus delemar RA 99-880]|eukprot:EIE89483.1 hypothetical protein RO3G_14194 [Rhizopus delemar RA 99-880]
MLNYYFECVFESMEFDISTKNNHTHSARESNRPFLLAAVGMVCALSFTTEYHFQVTINLVTKVIRDTIGTESTKEHAICMMLWKLGSKGPTLQTLVSDAQVIY